MFSPATKCGGEGASPYPTYPVAVLTLRAAAGLLAQADSLQALRAIARLLGFSAARSLSPDARHALHVDPLATEAELARTDGRLRCLSALLTADGDALTDADPRELTRRLCLAVAKRAPARDWCVITLDHTRQRLTIAVTTPDPRGTRVAALRIDRRRVVDSDADTLRSLAAVAEPDTTLRHARFVDILGRDALSNRFYRALESTVETLTDSVDINRAASPVPRVERRELALLCASRCLFLAFLEAKGWLDHDRQFLIHQTTARLERGGHLHERFLRPLFFGTLNTPIAQRARAARALGVLPFLNGGLFSPTPLEQRRRHVRFHDDALAALLIDLLDRYRFTAHEDSTRWSEAAIDPEMLGRAFESLMAADERHRSGTYYTPPTLVETVVHDALHAAIPGLPSDALSATTEPLALSPRTRDALSGLRVLDPACGSGAFLVHTLETLARLEQRAEQPVGDATPTHVRRRNILTQRIFGVDRNPMAVWLCELRLWLSIVIECPETRITHIPPLPNLDHHIRIGDTLAGGDFQFAPPAARRLTTLRERYARATGIRKRTLAKSLDHEERQRALAECQRHADAVRTERCAILESLRSRDLFGERHRRTRHDTQRLSYLRKRTRELTTQHHRLELGAALPFRFATQFADVAARGGFNLIVGNPPWVRPHALTLTERARLRTEFRSMRHAAWRAGATRAGAGVGFAAQADLSTAFVERGVRLLAPGGVAALLVPAKLWRALAGGGIREWLAEHTDIRTIRDWSNASALFDAAVYPSLIVAERLHPLDTRSLRAAEMPVGHETTRRRSKLSSTRPARPVHVSIAHRTRSTAFSVEADTLPLGHDPAAPWLLLPPAVRRAFDALRNAGPALGESAIGRPLLGVKCGLNAAFLVHAVEQDDEDAVVIADGRRAVIERRMLRPVLRGEGVALRRSAGTTPDLCIVWTHGPDDAPLKQLPPATLRWLSHWRPQLERRRDARARQPWWTLHRTEAARCEAPRVVWADIGKRLRPYTLAVGDPTVPLNSCYVLRTTSMRDAHAIEALLGSPLAAAWFDALAEPARGGFKRFLGWTVATLPTPPDWTAARTTLAELTRRRHHGESVSKADELTALAGAYGVPQRLLLPLLEWSPS